MDGQYRIISVWIVDKLAGCPYKSAVFHQGNDFAFVTRSVMGRTRMILRNRLGQILGFITACCLRDVLKVSKEHEELKKSQKKSSKDDADED